MKRRCWLLLFLLCAPFHLAQAEDGAGPACVRDLDDLAAFLPVNDSGASAALAHHGQLIASALADTRKLAAKAADHAACDTLLAAYLRVWRPGHLQITPWPWNFSQRDNGQSAPAAAPAVDPRAPALRVLGAQTVLLSFGSFYDGYKGAVEALLSEHRAELISHPNWIVDVRDNNGGADMTFAPLLAWLMDGDYVEHSVEWLATPANVQVQEDICAMTADAASCKTMMAPIVDAMRAATSGQFTLAGHADAIAYLPAPKAEAHQPARVAVLVDHACASSCDQFLLTVRQSGKVKLIGRPSGGQLDVSNLRPHLLPSGRRALFYATSRSLRVPAMPIDGIGVQPDILLPSPADDAEREEEIVRVQRWLEGGSLRPLPKPPR